MPTGGDDAIREERISLIIPSRDRPKHLEAAVDSVLSGELRPAEIVIVDQSSSPHARLAAVGEEHRCEIRYVHVRSPGTSAARNLGIERARHRILVFIDDDMLVSREWLASLVSALASAGPRTVVTGRVEPSAPERPGAVQLSTISETEPAVYAGRVDRDPLYTGNMACFRSAVQEIGGFDVRLGGGTDFPAAADNDLAFRLLEAGYRIRYVPDALVYHRVWRGPGEYVGVRKNYGLGQGAFYAKHFSLRDPHILRRAARQVMHYLLRLPGRAIRESWRARGDLAFLAGLATGFVRWQRRY